MILKFVALRLLRRCFRWRWRRCSRLHHHVLPHLVQSLGADSPHRQQIIHALKRPALLPVIQNPLRRHGPNSRQPLKQFGCRRIQINRFRWRRQLLRLRRSRRRRRRLRATYAGNQEQRHCESRAQSIRSSHRATSNSITHSYTIYKLFIISQMERMKGPGLPGYLVLALT